MMMAIMKFFIQMMPRKIRRKTKARPLGKKRVEAGLKHPSIEMNLENLLICMRNCGTCPSYPENSMEALFCASGESSSKITENGCNCVSCPLYDLCSSSNNTAYFCKNGSCSAAGEKEESPEKSKDCNSYLSHFVGNNNQEKTTEKEISVIKKTNDSLDVTLNFIGDKEIHTKTDVPILEASLAGGIDHTHVCGGRARCSTCRVIITDGIEHCQPRNEKEARLAARRKEQNQ